MESTSPALPSARYEPTDEALAAFERLEAWLVGPRGPVTELAEETVRAVERALIDGHRSFHHAAEDGLKMLKIRNGKTDGPDIVAGSVPEDWDFQADVEELLDLLHERMFDRGMGR